MKYIYITIILLLFSLIFSSCSKEGIDISNNNLTVLSYNELPNTVRVLLDNKINEVIKSNEKHAYSTNKKITFEHYRKNIKKNWLKEVNNNDDYFRINSKVYRLKGNNGSIFILHKGNIYYSERNVYLDEYKNQEYYQLSLEE